MIGARYFSGSLSISSWITAAASPSIVAVRGGTAISAARRRRGFSGAPRPREALVANLQGNAVEPGAKRVTNPK